MSRFNHHLSSSMSSISGSVPNFKIIIGPSGSGYPSLASCQSNDEDGPECLFAAMNICIVPIVYETTDGQVQLNMWELSHEATNNIAYWYKADAAILMFSYENESSFFAMPRLYDLMKNHISKDLPIVACGDKHDTTNPQITSQQMTQMFRQHNSPLADVPVYNMNIEKHIGTSAPFIQLLKRLMKNENLELSSDITMQNQ